MLVLNSLLFNSQEFHPFYFSIHQLLSALIIALSVTAVAIYQHSVLGWNIYELIISILLSRCVHIFKETFIHYWLLRLVTFFDMVFS